MVKYDIFICEPSAIVAGGIESILLQMNPSFNIKKSENFNDLLHSIEFNSLNLVLINLSVVHNRIDQFRNILKDNPFLKFTGIITSLHEPQLMSFFDSTITITDKNEEVKTVIKNQLLKEEPEENSHQVLSEREIEVLRLIVSGKSNKEIADILHLSIHTVITHRKNISQKTGIKTESGLTIYAVVKNIVSLQKL